MIRFLVLLFSSCLISNIGFSQNNLKQNMLAMNKLLVDFSPEQTANFNVNEQTGLVEQNFNELIQRYKLAEIGSIVVLKKDQGFSVQFNCKDSGKCVSFIRENATNVNLLGTSYFFNMDAAANTFAENAQQLVQHFKSNSDRVHVSLYVGENGKTNRLKIATSKLLEPEKKSNEKAEIRVTKSDDEDQEKEDEPISKPIEESKSKKKEKVDSDETKGGNELDYDISETRKEKQAKEFCNQINSLISSGRKSQFKDIEGKSTNAEKEINESTLKLKGAKRSYLTKYKSKRAFIGEFRVSSEQELMNLEYDKLQTQIEDCVPGDWEDIDHAEDEEYAEVEEQVRDIEYRNSKEKTSPSIRIIMLNDGKKYILFVRIQ